MNLRTLASYFELSRKGPLTHLAPMEGMRGFAALLVFAVHVCPLIRRFVTPDSVLSSVLSRIALVGNSGVDLFFVLSGFLIYGSLIRREQPFAGYMRRRIRRIYPTFLVMFSIYLVLSFATPALSKLPPSPGAAAVYLIENLLLLPGLFPIRPMITVAWSLSYELFFYLITPLAIGVFGMRSWSSSKRCWSVFGVAVLGLTYCALFDAEHSDMAEFAGGIILFERMSQAREPRLSSNVALAALVVGLLSLLLPVGGDAGDTLKALILCVTLYVLCLSILTNPSGWLTRVFMWRPLRWLGNMSYSFYLLHGLAINTLFSVLAKLLPSLNAGVFGSFVLALLALGVSAVGSALLFLLVERPLSLAQGEPRRPPAPSATSLDSSSAS